MISPENRGLRGRKIARHRLENKRGRKKREKEREKQREKFLTHERTVRLLNSSFLFLRGTGRLSEEKGRRKEFTEDYVKEVFGNVKG